MTDPNLDEARAVAAQLRAQQREGTVGFLTQALPAFLSLVAVLGLRSARRKIERYIRTAEKRTITAVSHDGPLIDQEALTRMLRAEEAQRRIPYVQGLLPEGWEVELHGEGPAAVLVYRGELVTTIRDLASFPDGAVLEQFVADTVTRFERVTAAERPDCP